MSDLLTPEILSHVGRSLAPITQVVTRRDIRKYSVATRQRQKKYLDGDEAPPLYHIALFWDVVEIERMSPDGISQDPLIPELPLKRAMAGGVRVEYRRPIVPGDVLVGTRTLNRIWDKQGSQGPLIFYEMELRLETEEGAPVLTETTPRIVR